MTDGGYESHRPLLIEAIRLTTGPILELGSGEGSTPIIAAASKSEGRLAVSAETDEAWLRKIGARYRSPRHQFVKVDDWRDFEEIEKRSDWSVALVDCAPGEDRPDLANRLAFRCRFVILHDTEKDSGGNYRYERCLGNFRHVVEYRGMRPYTMVCSNIERFPIEAIL